MPTIKTISPTGQNQTAEIVTKLNGNDIELQFAAGDYFVSAEFAGLVNFAIPIADRNEIKITGPATGVARVILKWEANRIEEVTIGGVTTAGTLGNIFRFSNCDDLGIDGITIDYYPPLFTQGAVMGVATDRRSFTFKPDMNFSFAWRSADFFGSYDKATGQFQETNFEDPFSDPSPPYTITEGPVLKEFTFTAPNQEDPDPGLIPDWMAAHLQIWIAVRKRLSSPYTIVGGTNLKANIKLRGAAAVGVVGNGLENPEIDFLCQGPGIISGAAGGVVLLDVRGTYTSNSHVSYGLGDDNLNVRTRLWDSAISDRSPDGVSPAFLRVECRNPLSKATSNSPEAPRQNESIEFWNKDGKLIRTLQIANSLNEGPGNQGAATRIFKVTFGPNDSFPHNYVPSEEGVLNG